MHEHDEERALGCTAVAFDREELFPQRLALTLARLDVKKFGGIVHIASGLNVVGPESAASVKRLVPLALLHVPAHKS